MPQATRMRWSTARILAIGALAVALAAGGSFAALRVRAGTGLTEQSPPAQPAENTGKAAARLVMLLGPSPKRQPIARAGSNDFHQRRDRRFTSGLPDPIEPKGQRAGTWEWR